MPPPLTLKLPLHRTPFDDHIDLFGLRINPKTRGRFYPASAVGRAIRLDKTGNESKARDAYKILEAHFDDVIAIASSETDYSIIVARDTIKKRRIAIEKSDALDELAARTEEINRTLAADADSIVLEKLVADRAKALDAEAAEKR